jgi:genome maintenance exonuclease 1
MFNYQNYQDISIENKRFYQISDETFYPSITTVLGKTLPQAKIDILENWKNRLGSVEASKKASAAADRGTTVHKLIESYLKKEPIEETKYPQAIFQIFNSLKIELSNINKVYGQEVVLYSDTFGIAGRCDLIGEYKNELCVVDYKTSTYVKNESDIEDYFIQATFYAMAHNEMFNTDISKIIILMGTEKSLPLIFKKTISEELVEKLFQRKKQFISSL